MSSYELVHNCTVDDGVGLATVEVSACWEEPWAKLQWPEYDFDKAVRDTAALRPEGLMIQRDTRRCQKVIEAETRDMVGFAIWDMPESYAQAWVDAQTPEVSQRKKDNIEQLARAAFRRDEYFSRLVSPGFYMAKRNLPSLGSQGDRFQMLATLEVHPAHQGKGVENMLLGSGMEVAKGLGLHLCHLARDDKTRDFLLQHGFKELDRHIEHLTDLGVQQPLTTYLMWKRHYLRN